MSKQLLGQMTNFWLIFTDLKTKLKVFDWNISRLHIFLLFWIIWPDDHDLTPNWILDLKIT